MASECEGQGKSSWPELVGVAGDVAVRTIEKENPLVDAVIIRPGQIITPDIRCDRVRVFVDANGNVDRVPIIQ